MSTSIDTTDAVAKLIRSFFDKYPSVHVVKGQIIVDCTEDPKGIMYLVAGKVRVFAISLNGNEWTLNTFKPGAFFPMSWAINNTQNAYYYEATENSVYRLAPRADVMAFLMDNPQVMHDLLRRVYLGTDGLLLRMGYLLAGDSYASLIVELLISAKRFGRPLNNELGVELVINQQDLASQAGMSRETVSREMAILKQKKLINFSHHLLTIPDIKLLEEELAGIH